MKKQNKLMTEKNTIKLKEFMMNKELEAKTIDKYFLQAYNLPLSRIKKVIKIEEEVQWIAREVPFLLCLMTEIFIEELALRAWMSVEYRNTKTLQIEDITNAVNTDEKYDFLVYTVPNEEKNLIIDTVDRTNMEE